MNRAQNVMLATAAAAITALALLIILVYTARSEDANPEIVLPLTPQEIQMPTSSHDDTAEVNTSEHNLIEITAQNVTTIVEDLSRPTEYTAINKTTRYWEGGEASKSYKVYVTGECSRIDEYGTDTPNTVIYTPETVYMPLGGQDQPIPRGKFTPDASMAMPTYEDVIRIKDVVGAGYVKRNTRPCVWVQTQDEQGYDISYWIDLENGLLTAAEARQNGLQAWSFELTELTIGAPDADVFLLPSGISALTEEQQG